MASRYPTIKSVDYCFSPIHVVDDDKDIIVPCGKCDGCLLHKANEWSMRCCMEIEDTPATIFGTLTYDNKYLPKLYPVVGNRFHRSTVGYDSLKVDFSRPMDSVCWISDHPNNIRFNSVRDVRRDDNIIISQSNYTPLAIQKWDNFYYPSINYASKRDVQLWLKLLRKYLYEQDISPVASDGKERFFRYYVISEVGPTTSRNHFHFLLFCQSREISEALIEGGIYENWKMCHEDRIKPYLRYCTSGAAGYVTQYLTCNSDLPAVYRENKEIRPFRLASKSPAVGFVGQDKEKIFKDISLGVIDYLRAVPRLESDSLLRYPSAYLASLFPKCYRFNKIADSRRFVIYKYIYEKSREYGGLPSVLLSRFFKSMHSSDYLASYRCYQFCKERGSRPEYYYYLLDTYYYKVAISRLRDFYLAQENCDFLYEPYRIFEFYPNIEVICLGYEYEKINLHCLDSVLSLGYSLSDMLHNQDFFNNIKDFLKRANKSYRNEVLDIKKNMVKMAKFNEEIGNSPTSV